MSELKLKPVKAYTVYSADDDRTSSEKGIYKNFEIAAVSARGTGWYGSNGEVREKKDLYEEESGELYIVKHVGKYTDIEAKYKEDTLASIKAKLTPEELTLLGIK